MRVPLVPPQVGKMEVNRFVDDMCVNASVDLQVYVAPDGLCVYGTTVVRIRDMCNEDSCP